MVGVLELIGTIGGLVIAPAFDFIKKKFLKPSEDSPEATMSSLATTKPEVLPQYVTALTGYMESQVKFFNRDVVGIPSEWVIDLRAAIRPLVTIACICGLIGDHYGVTPLDPGTRAGFLSIASSWFGSRISL